MNFEIAPKETETRASWENAMFYCFFLNIDGKTGWRLPAIDELIQIYNRKNDFEKSLYLSSTEGSCDIAWSYYFDTGYKLNNLKTNGGRVRAVRDLP